MHSIFITGTDTDAGKTYVSRLLLKGLAALNIRALGLKPIAAGVDADGQNADAKWLQALSAVPLSYAQVNPVLLQAPVAPHLAAVNEGLHLSFEDLDQLLQDTATLDVELRLIEGAGGWLLPLDHQLYFADWVQQRQLPVVLVVGMKLGCLNHAMLTARELQRSGVRVLGWVANSIDPNMLLLAENILDLSKRLPWPLLGVVPYQHLALAQSEATVQDQVQVQLGLDLASALLKQLNSPAGG